MKQGYRNVCCVLKFDLKFTQIQKTGFPQSWCLLTGELKMDFNQYDEADFVPDYEDTDIDQTCTAEHPNTDNTNDNLSHEYDFPVPQVVPNPPRTQMNFPGMEIWQPSETIQTFNIADNPSLDSKWGFAPKLLFSESSFFSPSDIVVMGASQCRHLPRYLDQHQICKGCSPGAYIETLWDGLDLQ